LEYAATMMSWAIRSSGVIVLNTESTHRRLVLRKGGAPGTTRVTWPGEPVGTGDWHRAKRAAKRKIPLKRMRFKT
jgi:hypothetical protein